MAVIFLDREVVLREPPGLAAEPALRDALRAELRGLPVLDGDDVGGPGDGRERQHESRHDEPCHCQAPLPL